MARQSLQGPDQTRSSLLDNANIFDDGFEVEDFEVADGFAPQRKNSVASRTSEDGTPPTISVAPPATQIHAESPRMAIATNRNSTRKSRSYMQENPFTSPEEDDYASERNETLRRTPSRDSQSTITYAPARSLRTVSSASSRAFARTHSPGLGAAGPSHPYSMYPQDTGLGRSISTSTTSTFRPSHTTSTSIQPPAHPYTMYPQNVDDESEDIADVEHPQHPRSHIPVGFPGMRSAVPRRLEDDNLSIGAHSEQLPAYSEYPEDGAPRHLVVPTPLATCAEAGSTSHAPFLTRLPQSMSDSVPDASGPLLPTSGEGRQDSVQSQKSWSEKSWKEKKKTKFCGMPFGWIILGTLVILFIVIVLSSAIGGFLSHERKKAATVTASVAADNIATPTNSLYDASPIPTSTQPYVPTGTFGIRPGAPQEVQDDCLVNQTQGVAWSCDLPISNFAISVGSQYDGGANGAFIYPSPGDQPSFTYGSAIPQTVFSPLRLVVDLDDPGRGDAYQFQAMYTKIVVAAPDAFDSIVGDSGNTKRHAAYRAFGKHWFTRHQISAGDKPWFCYWNSTMLEGFVYLTENATVPYNASISGSSTVTQSFSAPTGSPYPSPYTNSWLPIYPQVIKIEERRIPGSPPPYCQKMQILDDGQAGLLTDPDTGAPIQVQLEEQDPGHTAYPNSGSKKRNVIPGACHCQWFSGGS